MGHNEKKQYSQYENSRRRWEREKGTENIFKEIESENFSNLERETHIQIQEAQMIQYRVNLIGLQ